MATDRSGLLAQTYLLPQQPAQQAAAPKPFVDEIGNPETGLQQIDGVTSDYFEKWAALKGFARDVWENYGVDVRYADPSVPESNRLHRIYLKSIADLKKQGERLKTGQKMYEADRQRGALINADPRQQYYDELNAGTDIVDTKLDPIVSEANNKLQQLYFGNAIKEAQQYYGQIKSRLEQLRDTQPNQAGYWQRQLDALTPPTKAVREFDPYRDHLNTGKINAAGQMVKKVANMMEGTAEGFQLSPTVFGPNGERVWVNKDLSEINIGNGRIKEWRRIPSTGETSLLIERDGPIRPDGTVSKVTETMPLSGMDAVSITKLLVSDNPKFGSSGDLVDLYAQKNNLFNDAGEVAPGLLVDEEQRKKIQTRMGEQETAERAQKEKGQMEQLLKQLSEMEPGAFFGDTKEFKLPNGEVLEIYRGTKGYYIENLDRTTIGTSMGKKEKDRYKKAIPYNVLKNLLLSQKAHLQLGTGTESVGNRAEEL